MDRLTSTSSIGWSYPSLPESPGKSDSQAPADESQKGNSSEVSNRASFATGRVPLEVMRFILSYLPLPDLNSARVSHSMRALCDDAIASRYITLSEPEHIETVAKAFGKNPYIRVTLSGNSFTGAHLAKLPQSLKNLSLYNCNGLGLDGLMQVVELKELEELTINGNRQVANPLFKRIGQQLPKLRHLNLDTCYVLSEAAVASGLLDVTWSKGLEELTLCSKKLTNDILQQIGQRLPKLRCLNLNGSKGFKTDGLVSMLPHLASLEEFHIATYGTEVVTDEVLKQIGLWLPKLRCLSIYDSKRFTADGLVSMLKKLGHLKELVLMSPRSKISSSQGLATTLDPLKPLQMLERFIIDDGNEFTHRAFMLKTVGHLKELVPMRPRSMISSSQGPDTPPDQLEPLQKLERLIVDDGNGFTGEHRAFIQEKLKTMQISIKYEGRPLNRH